ncbi:MAG: excinuclease ABC subunit UvrC [Prevotella sp.]|nr:excinuclease ABC subunit UvrC [Alistipes senegalensis]MCM1357272.1 excinuclease ABC subunit UvrC [Prevotella sp.]MCM1473178.1 excinuclease ABC subunit UvrC [Muribaculaceae bacterium]
MNPRLPYLREKTSKLTESSGVYIMKDKNGNIIYIGKAKNLHRRVSSYFRENADHTPKVTAMVSNVNDYDFIVTDSEYEALLLECSLIKQNQPKYNILLKDDKGYHYIRISDDEYPRITAEKNTLQSGKYSGPYTSGFVAKETVDMVNRVFRLPTCCKKFPHDFRKSRPCLNYHIKNCMGVCTGKISREEYAGIIRQAENFIKKGSVQALERMEEEMNQAAENLEFEKAAVIRDRIAYIKKSYEKQKIINNTVENADIIGIAEFYDGVYISVLIYRNNRLYDKSVIEFSNNSDDDILTSFMTQYYYKRNDIPELIIVENLPEDYEIIRKMLDEQSGHKVTITTAKRGNQSELLRLAKNNSAEYAALKNNRTGKEVIALEQLAKVLGLDKPPKYIEAYDISNLADESIVAGMVVFVDGRPFKKAYKRFSIKQIRTQNDYESMYEVLERRLMHIINQDGDEYFRRKPDLILLDGGKGHVNIITELVRNLNIDINVFGMVKDNKHRTRAITSGGNEIQINNLQSAFNLVTRIQDEVHRYSVSYMHSKHRKKTYLSELTTVKGIGEKKSEKLMIKYKTKDNLKNATPEELAVTAGVNLNTARELWEVIQNL